MDATILKIEDRHRQVTSVPASLKDFTTSEVGTINAVQLVENPEWSLYCLDDTTQRAIFVELPRTENPALHAFFYLSQFETAQRLAAIDYANFHPLADQITIDSSRLLFVHNIGRCGSTLLHHIFNRIPDVTSLSEPDAIGNLHYFRHYDGSRDAEMIQLLRSSLKFLFRPALYPASRLQVVKLRNQMVEDIHLFFAAFPEAKHLFMYRSALGWISSLYGRRLRAGAPLMTTLASTIEWMEGHYNRPISLATLGLAPLPEQIPVLQQLAISWLWMMNRVANSYAEGYSMSALRYEELNFHRSATLTRLFDRYNLPQESIDDALAAFGEDSQAGTRLARADASKGMEVEFTDDDLANIEAILLQHPTINHSDFLLPNTILADART